MKRKFLLPLALVAFMAACSKDDKPDIPEPVLIEDAAAFAEISTLNIGEAGAAEISAFDNVQCTISDT